MSRDNSGGSATPGGYASPPPWSPPADPAVVGPDPMAVQGDGPNPNSPGGGASTGGLPMDGMGGPVDGLQGMRPSVSNISLSLVIEASLLKTFCDYFCDSYNCHTSQIVTKIACNCHRRS